MRSFLVASLMSTAAFVSGCSWWYGTSNTPTTASSGEAKAAGPTSEPGAKPVDLAAYKLPLTIDLPASAAVEAAGEDVKVTVGDSELRVGQADDEIGTVAKAKAYYGKDAPVEYVKEEPSLLVWKIGGGQQGFLVLAEAQGKTYSCEGSGTAAKIEPSIARCKSLKAAAGTKAEADTKTEAKKADTKQGPPKPVSLATYKLPLSIDLPPDAEINDLGNEVTISVGDSLLRVGNAAPGESTIAAAKATQDASFKTDYLKQEADLLLWQRGDKEREFLVLAKHAGKTYACKGIAPNASVDAEIARCKSLKPAK